jgi:hypothetical protein
MYMQLKNPGVYTLGTERKITAREQRKENVKKSTPLPYHTHKDISISLESTLSRSL